MSLVLYTTSSWIPKYELVKQSCNSHPNSTVHPNFVNLTLAFAIRFCDLLEMSVKLRNCVKLLVKLGDLRIGNFLTKNIVYITSTNLAYVDKDGVTTCGFQPV